MSRQSKAFICGCKGLSLEAQERAQIARHRPWGLILFKRNIESPAQVAASRGAYRVVRCLARRPSMFLLMAIPTRASRIRCLTCVILSAAWMDGFGETWNGAYRGWRFSA
jgi:beta-glucosidase-like glycosyl hydrolase